MSETEEWLCPECGERTNLMRATVTNQRTGQTGVKFQCLECGYTLTTRTQEATD